MAEDLPVSRRVKPSAEGLGTGIRSTFYSLIFAVAGVSGAHATTVSWGSEIFSVFSDSNGNALDGSFQIQLGFFEDVGPGQPFTPTSENVTEWVQRWRVFDQASLNLGGDYFTSEAEVNANGTGSSSFAGLGLNFVGMEAYIFIRNDDDPVPGSEWFLATAPTWVFPVGSDDCCDPNVPVQFSVTDLQDPNPDPDVTGTPVIPVWGRQSGQTGSGSFTASDPLYSLQTFTFVPEPSTLLLTLAGSCLLLIRRRPTA